MGTLRAEEATEEREKLAKESSKSAKYSCLTFVVL